MKAIQTVWATQVSMQQDILSKVAGTCLLLMNCANVAELAALQHRHQIAVMSDRGRVCVLHSSDAACLKDFNSCAS